MYIACYVLISFHTKNKKLLFILRHKFCERNPMNNEVEHNSSFYMSGLLKTLQKNSNFL